MISAFGSLADESTTVIVLLIDASCVPSPTASFATKLPDCAYVWLVVNPVPVFPSPKSHSKVRSSPSGSEDPAALNVTGSPAFTVPLGSTDMVAVGALLLPSRSVHPASIGARKTTTIRHARSPVLAILVDGPKWSEINPTAP